jgi:hypothetical protein
MIPVFERVKADLASTVISFCSYCTKCKEPTSEPVCRLFFFLSAELEGKGCKFEPEFEIMSGL